MRYEAEPSDLPRMITRRQIVEIAGVTLIGTTIFGIGGTASAFTQPSQTFPRVPTGPVRPVMVAGAKVGTLDSGAKPVYVARPRSRDPVEHSVADTLFWGDIMMEHAMFFVMLMPGRELAEPRAEAAQFQKSFSGHLARLLNGRLDRTNYAAFNRLTLSLVRPFIEYKRRMEEAQSSGRIRSLVWPSFFAHTRREAERFVRRLEQLNRGDTSYARPEVIPFWSDKMAEHALFIAHLLDIDQDPLIAAAERENRLFRRLEKHPLIDRRSARAAVQQIIDFKTAAAKGIEAGQIQSIIHPALADHVRREAVRFKDELDRAA
jgi:hypothetical protein